MIKGHHRSRINEMKHFYFKTEILSKISREPSATFSVQFNSIMGASLNVI